MRASEPASAASGSRGGIPGRDTAELRAYLTSFLLAALVGVLGGLAALGFQHATDLARTLWISGAAGSGLIEAARALPWWQALLIPAVGGGVASLIVYGVFGRFADRSSPDILETVS